jgi:hypothetical protein
MRVKYYVPIGRSWLATAVIIATTFALAFGTGISRAETATGAANRNPGVLPPSSEAFGKTYGGWSAAWWKYVEAQPVRSNPLEDSTGAGCRTAQSGQVFFLVGANGSGTATRNKCVVPSGKALFFPLINAFDTEPGFTEQQVWEELEAAFGPITSLHASIDGQAVGNLNPTGTPYRTCAGPVARCSARAFSIFLPSENFFGAPEGTYAPTVDDGVYLLLAPLSEGPHTISFGGTAKFLGKEFSQNITYHLVVSSS